MGFHLDHPGREGDILSGDSGEDTGLAKADRFEPASSRPRSHLIEIIEGEIIPRLFLAHRDRLPHPSICASANDWTAPEALTRHLLAGQAAEIAQRLKLLLDKGEPRKHIYLDMLAPVPRTLSRFWAEGHCSFDEVAAGLCCLDDVLRLLHESETRPPEPH